MDSSSSAEIQATHQIIQIFERSKMQVDDDLDSLPGIYAIVNLDGQIYKGNKLLGSLFETDHEYLIERNISDLFAKEDWDKLRQEILSISQNLETVESKSVNLQYDIVLGGVRRNYVWTCCPISIARKEGVPKLVTILGRDITEQINATEKNVRMTQELEMAALIQTMLFPPNHATFGESSIAGFYLSATECAGDWWYYMQLGDKLYIWIGDVEGHGVPSAMITSAVRAVICLVDKLDLAPGKMLGQLSKVVSSVAMDQKVMTMSIAVVNLSTGELTYANAAHEPGYLVLKDNPADSKRIKSLPFQPASPLGFSKDYKYVEYKLPLSRGDRVILFTDGIYEIVNSGGQKWARMSFARTLDPLMGEPRGALDLVEKIKGSITDFRQKQELVDDVTFVAFQF